MSEVAHPAERVEEVGERVVRLLNVHRHARADSRQHVVPAEEQPPLSGVETDVAGRVAGCVQGHKVPSGQRHRGAILEEHVGLDGRDELANAHRGAGELVAHLLRDPSIDQQGAHIGEQRVDPEPVARGDEGGVGGMQRDPCP